MYVQPLNVGWHFGKRVDFSVGYGFMAPTGQYTSGASNNIGSGYWGHNVTSGTTLYITKNKGTSANLATDWETHGSKNVAGVPAGRTSKVTPGQAFTTEWGIGQVLPLKKDLSILAQLGFAGYRPMAGFIQRRQLLGTRQACPGKVGPLSPQVHGGNLHQDVTRTLERLRRSPSSAHNPGLGDPFVLQQNFDDLSLTELKNMFGDQFTSATSALPAGSWQGPIASGHRGA